MEMLWSDLFSRSKSDSETVEQTGRRKEKEGSDWGQAGAV